jgi:hypothetical protein
MAQAAIATQIHQTLDTHAVLSTQVTFHVVLPYGSTQRVELTFV